MTGIRKGGGGKTQGKGKRRQPALRVVATDGQRVGTEGIGAAPCGPESQVAVANRRPKTRGAILPTLGVTAKEEAFCQAVANGASQSEAFRRSHDAADMNPDTVSRQAVRVVSRDRVRTRIDQLLQEKQRLTLHDRTRALAWALERLQSEAEQGDTAGARVTAVSLVMRHHALLTDKTETDVHDHRTAEDLTAELRERLERLLAPQPRVA